MSIVLFFEYSDADFEPMAKKTDLAACNKMASV